MKFAKSAVALSAAAIALLSACTTPASAPTSAAPAGSPSSSAPAPASSGATGALNITILPKNLGNPYFDTSTKGAKAAADEIGAKTEQVGPATAAADTQVPYIETATQQKVSAIELSANDQTALCDSVKAAQAAGVKVVTYDSDAPGCRDLFVNQATTEGIGKVLVEMIAQQIGDDGEIAIVSGAANATNQNAWIAVMKTELAASHPKVKLVDIVYPGDDDQASFDATAGLLQKYPNLKGIVSPTTVGIAAAARYISASDFKGKVALTGLGTPNDMRNYVKDGTVKEFALWNPEDLGYLTTYAVKAIVDGTITGAKGDKFTAGKLGEFTVGDDHTVLLGDPYKFNADNIDNFNF